MRSRTGRVMLGVLAAAIAVLTAHQTIVFLLDASGLVEREAWSLAPVEPWGVPAILNAVFWGGLWGAVLGAVYEKLPGHGPVAKGLVLGWGIFVLANCLLLPLIKGKALAYGLDPAQLLSVFLILSGFGVATAGLYAWLLRRV